MKCLVVQLTNPKDLRTNRFNILMANEDYDPAKTRAQNRTLASEMERLGRSYERKLCEIEEFTPETALEHGMTYLELSYSVLLLEGLNTTPLGESITQAEQGDFSKAKSFYKTLGFVIDVSITEPSWSITSAII